jgi:hypothetical protein
VTLVSIPEGSHHAVIATPQAEAQPTSSGAVALVPLKELAWARSGDKGNNANIGVIARRPEYQCILRERLTAEAVAETFAPYLKGSVERWELPGLPGFNFLLEAVLGGSGGTSTLRYDPQGKSFAATLLATPIAIPATWLESSGLIGASRAGEAA